MNEVKASGRTLEEALQLAAEELGVGLEAIGYEILEEGSKGFLGLGQAPTVVRAWIRGQGESVSNVGQPAQADEEQESAGGAEAHSEAEEPVCQAEQEDSSGSATEDETELLVETILKTVREIIEPMKVKARPVLKSASPEEIVVDLVGPEVGILIGRRGQTLDALQYLVGVIVNRRVRCRRRIILDAENYRNRHREMLERKAKEYAKAVKEQGKEAVLEPQCARDRRIIHLALADDPDVYTYSEGEGEERHVVISPKKK